MPEKPRFWPATEEALAAAGYQAPTDSNPSACKACRAAIQFWRTPAGKSMPLSRVNGHLMPHFSDCPEAQRFQRKKAVSK